MSPSTNMMRRPRIEKVVVNISVGRSGDPLQKAMKVLEQLTKQRPCQRKAKRTIRDWGIHRNEPIACLVTLRGEEASDFLKRGFSAVGNRISKSSFDSLGNFAFGFGKHIDIPGVRYDPELGIYGMNVCVTMEMPGYRVKKRRIGRARVGRSQRLRREESITFMKEEFGIEVIGE